MNFQSIMDDPVVLGIVLAAIGTLATGLRLVWNALIGAIVRSLNQLAPAHTGDDAELVTKVQRYKGNGKIDHLMVTMAPKTTINREVQRLHSVDPPPEDDA